MTEEQLEAIRHRAEKATKGPWEQIEEIDGIYGGRKTVIRTTAPSTRWTSRIVSVGQTRRHISDDAEDNTNFIANARQDVPALLAEVERLKKENEKYEGALSQIAHGDTWTAYPHDIAAWALGWEYGGADNANEEIR